MRERCAGNLYSLDAAQQTHAVADTLTARRDRLARLFHGSSKPRVAAILGRIDTKAQPSGGPCRRGRRRRRLSTYQNFVRSKRQHPRIFFDGTGQGALFRTSVTVHYGQGHVCHYR